MNATTITELAGYIAEVATNDGGEIHRVEMGEMADGSRRWYALVDTYSAGLEQQYRVTSPAPENAPAWAQVHTGFRLEVRTGPMTWLELDVEYDEAAS